MTARFAQDGENHGFPDITIKDIDGDTITIGEAQTERVDPVDTPVLFIMTKQKDEATSVHLSRAGAAAVHAALGLWLEDIGASMIDDD